MRYDNSVKFMWIMVAGIILLSIATIILMPSWLIPGIIVFALGFVMSILGILGCIVSMVKSSVNMVKGTKLNNLTLDRKIFAIILILVGVVGTGYCVVQVISILADLPKLFS